MAYGGIKLEIQQPLLCGCSVNTPGFSDSIFHSQEDPEEYQENLIGGIR
jgi:hypothetical protein